MMTQNNDKKGNGKYEHLLYALIIILAFACPLLQMGVTALKGNAFEWEPVLQAWMNELPFLALFLIHSLLLLPILVDKRQAKIYALLSLLLVGTFYFYSYSRHQRNGMQIPEPPQRAVSRILHQPADLTPPFIEGEQPPRPNREQPARIHFRPDADKPMRSFGKFVPVIIDTLIAVLIMACNLAIRLMFRHYKNIKRMEELERAQMRQMLEQLRAQISPHFFMNSLNNIHGMVEINPQKTQDMILELSGMMRHVLYESSKIMITLSEEIDFLNNYIALMRERYTKDRVTINCKFPDKEAASSICIPPLIFIVFVENAFKHGISYQDNSFVSIEISVHQSELVFGCLNSNFRSVKKNKFSGLGLDNIRKRLNILYADNYTLEIDEQDNTFNVTLIIPTKNENKMYSHR